MQLTTDISTLQILAPFRFDFLLPWGMSFTDLVLLFDLVAFCADLISQQKKAIPVPCKK